MFKALSENLYAGGESADDVSQNTAKQVGTVSGTDAELKALFHAARKNFASLTTVNQDKPQSSALIKAIREAVKTGKASNLTSAIK